MRPSLSFKAALLASSLLLGVAPVWAQDAYESYPDTAYDDNLGQTGNRTDALPRDLQLTVAVGVGVAPEYFGADDYEAVFVPSVDLEYHNAFLVVNREAMMVPYDGLGYKILSNENWAMGASLLYDPGRDDDSDRINGMGDIDGTALAGGFIAYQYHPVFARASLHMDVLNEYDGGYRGEVGAGVKGQLSPFLKGMLETSAHYGSENYNETFYNVSGGQSAATGLAPYDADAGFYQWGVNGVLQYNITPGLFVQGQARYDRVLDEAKNSSITADENQFYLGTNVGYQF